MRNTVIIITEDTLTIIRYRNRAKTTRIYNVENTTLSSVDRLFFILDTFSITVDMGYQFKLYMETN